MKNLVCSQKWNRALKRCEDNYDLAYILGLEDYNSYVLKETKSYLLDPSLADEEKCFHKFQNIAQCSSFEAKKIDHFHDILVNFLSILSTKFTISQKIKVGRLFFSYVSEYFESFWIKNPFFWQILRRGGSAYR